MVTIKDVAREAAVSGSTVSHVINGTRYVSPETAQRVEAAIARLGFRPSGVAQALKGGRTCAIGMVVTSSTNPFFAELIHAVETACFARGYSLILCNSEDDSEKFQTYLDTLRSKRIDALVILSANAKPGLTARLAAKAGVPVVAIDEEDAGPATSVVDDSLTGGALAARYLTGYGFFRIACVSGPESHPRSAIRLRGFSEGLAEAGLSLDPGLVIRSDLSVSGGYRAMRTLLALPDEKRPQAVFCFNDVMAFGALSAAQEQGLRVPEDISVMGYDDIELAAFTAPALTTIRQPVSELGQEAARIIIDHLESGETMPGLIKLQPQLARRRSVGRPPERK